MIPASKACQPTHKNAITADAVATNKSCTCTIALLWLARTVYEHCLQPQLLQFDKVHKIHVERDIKCTWKET